MEDLKWYVLNYDFNKRKIINFNIFNNFRFTEGIKELLNHYTIFDDFIEQLDKLLMYCFWSKREYEISVGDAFDTNLDRYEKIDVYSQIKPNIGILARYIVTNC